MSDELSSLKSLWAAVFGDEPVFIDGWFSRFYHPELTACIYENSSLAAAAYVLPFGMLSGLPCAHIYAVGVMPSLRGRGYGIRVTNEAVRLAQKAGFSAIALHPAEPSLYGFYQRYCGFYTAFTGREESLILPEPSERFICCRAEDYLRSHEYLLANREHVTPNLSVLNWFTQTGGRLFTGTGWCAAVEVTDNVTIFHELLYQSTRPDASVLASMAGSKRAVLRSPDPNGSPQGMLFGRPSFSCGWLGLTLE